MTLVPRRRPPLALTLTALLLSGAALAQAPAPAPAAPTPPAKPDTGLERAQRQADAVFHWIKLNGDRGANRQPVQAAPSPAAAAVPTAARKPSAPAPTPAVARASAPAPAPAPSPATAPERSAQAAPTPMPAPALAPTPAPEPAPVLLAAASPLPTPADPLPLAVQATAAPAPAPEAEAPLRLLQKVEPTFPRQMQQSQRSGLAQVQFTVLPDGSVGQAQAIKASHSRLGAAAVEAVKQWRFAPIAKAREAAVEVSFNADN